MSPIDRTVPHTVWWWVEDGDPIPAPHSASFDNADDAEAAARKFIENRNDPDERLRWVRVFRSSNEQYETFRWTNPQPFAADEDEYDPFMPTFAKTRRVSWWQKLILRRSEQRS